MTVVTPVLEHAGRRPGRLAVVSGPERLTYGELAAAVTARAADLRQAAPDGARVGLALTPGTGFVTAFLAAADTGRAAVVLHPGWSDRELRHAIATSRPAVVVASGALAERVRSLAEDPRVLDPATIGGAGRLARPAATPAPGVDDQQPFYVGFTSGTTGRPKGFVRHHGSWLRSFDAATAVFGIDAGDRVLAPGPLEHSLFLFAALHTLSVGAALHLQPRFGAQHALRTLTDEAITRVWVVPTMLDALVRAAAPAGLRLPHVRSVISSGARWPATLEGELRSLFPAATRYDFYGASELSFVTMRRPDDDDPPTSVGRPFPGVEVAVRHTDGRPAPTGDTGRIWVRSDMLFTGYLGDPGEDAGDKPADGPGDARRDADGWVTVGDVGRMDAAGRLHLAGRAGTMLICGGLNVYPEEIEAVLLDLPEVAEVAVVGLPHPRWGHELCAVLRWRDGARVPRSRLRAHCRVHLARGKRPQRWLEVDGLPRTMSGKVARRTLADGLCDGTVPAQELS